MDYAMNKKKAQLRTLPLLIPAVFGCSSTGDFLPPDGEPLSAISSSLAVVSPELSTVGVLGQAYDKRKQTLFNLNCVEGETEVRGNSRGSIKFRRDQSFDQLFDSISGSLSVGLSLPVVKAQAGASIARSHASTELSETYHLVWEGAEKTEVFVPSSLKLSEDGQFYAENESSRLEELCGDEFITEIHKGASFLATLKVDFLNSEDRNELQGMLDVSVLGGVVEVKGELERIDEEKKRRTTVSLLVEQEGGRPEQLLDILPDNVVTCGLDDPEPCLEAFRRVIGYTRESLRKQLEDESEYNVVKYVTQSYADSGFRLRELLPPAGYAIVEEAVDRVIRETERSLRFAMADQQRASDLLRRGGTLLSDAQRPTVIRIKDAASRNFEELLSLSGYCYANMNKACLQRAAETEQRLEEYDPGDLEVSVAKAEKPVSEGRGPSSPCQRALDRALAAGLISPSSHSFYQSLGWAPHLSGEGSRLRIEFIGPCFDE